MNPSGVRRWQREAAALLAAATALCLASCSQNLATVHPRYYDLATKSIFVPPVNNETLYTNLEEFDLASVLTRSALGGQEVDILSVLREGLVDSLRERGYQASTTPESEGALEANELHIRLRTFRPARLPSRREILGRFEVTLVPPGDESQKSEAVLYYRPASFRAADRTGAGISPVGLRRGIFQAASMAVSELPPLRMSGGARPAP